MASSTASIHPLCPGIASGRITTCNLAPWLVLVLDNDSESARSQRRQALKRPLFSYASVLFGLLPFRVEAVNVYDEFGYRDQLDKISAFAGEDDVNTASLG